MRSLTTLGAAFAASALLASAAFAAAPASMGTKLTANLTGSAETKTGDPDGKGTAIVTVNTARNQLCYTLSVSGIAKASAAHIHKGEPGKDGGPVVMLKAPAGGSSKGCTAVRTALAKAMAADPDDYYINVHNAEFPDGAIRGQLKK